MMKKRLIGGLLALFLALALMPAAAQAAGGVTLYKVNQRDPQSHVSVVRPDRWNNWNIPYRLSPGGPIQGEIPWGTVLAATGGDGTWLRVRYGGRDCYVYQAKVSRVSQPDIVCSPWAKERLSYYGGYIGTKDAWPDAANDWTQPITRADMAEILFLLFRGGDPPYAGDMPFYREEQFTDLKLNQHVGGVNIGAAAHFLAGMGVIPGGGEFNAAGSVTWAEFTEALLRLSAYTDKYLYDSNRGSLTLADIRGFAVGGGTGADAKITMEQAKILRDASKCWDKERYWQVFEAQRGATLMAPGGFALDVALGKYPYQPHVVIGADGKGELSNAKRQFFRVSYKKTVPAVNPKNAALATTAMLFTMQTENGKYLALDGLPANGSRLITRDAEFLWWIRSGSNGLGKQAHITVPGFYDQYLNASGRGNKDGTPLITWYEANKWQSRGDAGYPQHTEFNFYMAYGQNANTPTVATTLRHGRTVQSYPAKTVYKVGEGFDSSGFSMLDKDDNNGGIITDVSANYSFYTSDGVKLTQGRPFQTAGVKLVEIKGDLGNGRLTLAARYFITVTDGSHAAGR